MVSQGFGAFDVGFSIWGFGQTLNPKPRDVAPLELRITLEGLGSRIWD